MSWLWILRAGTFIMKRFFVLIFAAIAFVSCNDKDSKQDWSGMEYYTFDVSGKVTDASASPIQGITVEALGTKTFTKADGTYNLKGNGNGLLSILFVNFSDTDEESNGGKFMGMTRGVTLNYVTGAHGPYLGLFSMTNVDVVLTPNAVVSPPSTNQPTPLP